MTSEKKEILQEAKLLQMIDHENVMPLYKLAENTEILYLVFPFLQSDLRQFMSNEYVPETNQTKKIITMILRGVEGMHKVGIVHRDLKPANILVNVHGGSISDLKICDLGLAQLEKEIRSKCGTYAYMAPEMWLDEGYDRKVDVWVRFLVFYPRSELYIFNWILFLGDGSYISRTYLEKTFGRIFKTQTIG